MLMLGRYCRRKLPYFSMYLLTFIFIYLILDILSVVPSQKSLATYSSSAIISSKNEVLLASDVHDDKADDKVEVETCNTQVPGNASHKFQNYKRPSHPEVHLKCVHKLTANYFQRLNMLRQMLLESNRTLAPKGFSRSENVAFHEDGLYFAKLKQEENIHTLFLNTTMADAQKCMNPQFSYTYGSNDCAATMTRPKRHDLYGKQMYGLKCSQEMDQYIERENFLEQALVAGLPPNFTHPRPEVTLTFIHVITNAFVDRSYGDVWTEKFKIVNNRCHTNFGARYMRPPSGRTPFYPEVFTIKTMYGHGVYHGNVEELARLALYIPFLLEHPKIKIHLGAYHVFMNMMHLPFDKSRYIYGAVRAGIVYFPAGAGCCRPSAFTTQVQSFYLRQSLPNLWTCRDTIILVHRSHGRRSRYFQFHTQIAAHLTNVAKQLGLNFWVFDDNPVPPIAEAAAMFNRAILVVAPHGAGQSNMLFTQPDTALVEGLCIDPEDGLVNLAFRNLAHQLGGYYYGLFRNRPWRCPQTKPEDLAMPVYQLLHHILTLQASVGRRKEPS